MTDTIRLTGIEVFGYHGVFSTEREQGQLFIVDVEIHTDLSRAAASDALGDTVDYGTLASAIHELVAVERWDLIERVAGRVADLVLARNGVDAVEVTVHKPQVPLGVSAKDVSVTIRRTAG